MANIPLYVILVAVAAIAFTRVHLRVKTTLTGYEIGRLKAAEGRLLAEKSELTMELARLTGRDSLEAIDSSSHAPVPATTQVMDIAANNERAPQTR